MVSKRSSAAQDTSASRERRPAARRRTRRARTESGRQQAIGSSETAQRILEAATRCIGRSGFDGASTLDIAREAGVSKALVLYHFETKEQLLLAVQKKAFLNLAAGINALTSTEGPSREQALAAFDRVWGLLVALRDQIPFTMELFLQSSRRGDPKGRLQGFNTGVQQLIKHALRETLGPDADDLPLPPERLATPIYLIIGALAMHAYFAPDLETAQRTYSDMRLLLERALRPVEEK